MIANNLLVRGAICAQWPQDQVFRRGPSASPHCKPQTPDPWHTSESIIFQDFRFIRQFGLLYFFSFEIDKETFLDFISDVWGWSSWHWPVPWCLWDRTEEIDWRKCPKGKSNLLIYSKLQAQHYYTYLNSAISSYYQLVCTTRNTYLIHYVLCVQ